MTTSRQRPTLLFEALAHEPGLCHACYAVARLMGQHDTWLWPVIDRCIDLAKAGADLFPLTPVTVDETAARRSHNRITLFVHIDQTRVVFAAEGEGALPSATGMASFAGSTAGSPTG